MLNVKIINSDFSVNNFEILDSKSFVPGENFTLALRIYQSERNLRYISGSSATITIQLQKSDGTTLEKDATINSSDSSLIYAAITSSESSELVGGNIKVVVDVEDDGTNLLTGISFGTLKKIITDVSC